MSGVQESPPVRLALDMDTGHRSWTWWRSAPTTPCVAKAPSTPDARLLVLDKAAVPGAAIERILHGTTVVTNTVLPRRGAEVRYVTTAAFEDIPFIQRISGRSETSTVSSRGPLVRRRNCLPMAEWMGTQAQVVVPLEAITPFHSFQFAYELAAPRRLAAHRVAAQYQSAIDLRAIS